MPTFIHKPRRHVWDRRKVYAPAVPPPVAGVLVSSVLFSGGQSFTWFFDSTFENPAGPVTAADFAGLRVGSEPPVDVDEIVSDDGTVTLIYDLPDPSAPGLEFEVLADVPVLHFTSGQPLAVPQDGPVGG